jgi:hypothetical protein
VKSVQHIREPKSQQRFGIIFLQSLEDTDRKPGFGILERINADAVLDIIVLFPLEKFLGVRVTNPSGPLVVVEDPLDDIRERTIVDPSFGIPPKGRR